MATGVPEFSNYAEQNANYFFEDTNTDWLYAKWQPEFTAAYNWEYNWETYEMEDVLVKQY